jgi:hypothetical protein
MLIFLKNTACKLLGVTILLSTLMQISACAKTDREEQIYQLIRQGVELAEGHKLGDLMAFTKDSFTAGPGNHSRQDVRRILFVAFKRFGKFSIHYPRPSIRLSDDQNTAIVKMSILMASKDSIFPELKLLYDDTSAWVEAVDKSADIYTLSLELEYESDRWLVKKARISSLAIPHGRL